ncbi:MAG: molecular chaperone TorD family protein [Thermoprotei archaeon]
MNTVQEYCVINRNRAMIYYVLSKVYEKEISKIQILEIKTRNGLFPGLKTSETLPKDVQKGLDLIKRYLNNTESLETEMVEIDLAEDYAGIFLGVRGVVPHPSESAYMTKDHTIFQKQRDEILQMYQQMGLQKDPSFPEPEDHIALELCFMARLANQTVNALELKNLELLLQMLRYQQSFMDQHLVRWVPKLCQDIYRSARTDFYKGVALFTRGFINLDRAMINMFIKSLPHLLRST